MAQLRLKGEIVTLDKDEVEELFEEAESQMDYMAGLYNMAYGGNIIAYLNEKPAVIDSWPKVNPDTAQNLCRMAVKADERLKVNAVIGGFWLNKGFSPTGKDLDDWQVQLTIPQVEE